MVPMPPPEVGCCSRLPTAGCAWLDLALCCLHVGEALAFVVCSPVLATVCASSACLVWVYHSKLAAAPILIRLLLRPWCPHAARAVVRLSPHPVCKRHPCADCPAQPTPCMHGRACAAALPPCCLCTAAKQVTASHPTILGLTGFPQQYSAAPGSTTNICIPTTGQLLLTTSGCFVFGPNRGTYTIDVSPEHPLQPLALQAERVNVAGELAVSAGSTSLTGSDPETADSTDSSSANSLPRVITIAVADPGSSDAAQVVQAVARDPARPGVYSYRLTIHLGASVVLTPSVYGSSSLLLHPRSRVYAHDAASRECPPAVAAFEAKPGRMLAGVVEPAVEGGLGRPTAHATVRSMQAAQIEVL